MPSKDRAQLQRTAADQLESLHLAGVLQIPKRKATKSKTKPPATTEVLAQEDLPAVKKAGSRAQETPPQKSVAAAAQDVPPVSPVKTTTSGWKSPPATSLFAAGEATTN